jgi:hypothetical protein
LYIHVHLLAGTLSPGEPIILQFYANNASLQYHHLVGYQGPTVFEEQIGTVSEVTEVASSTTDEHAADSEERWLFLSDVNVSATNDVAQIPINSSCFGSWAFRHAARFNRWRGTLRFKIVPQALRNDALFVTQGDLDLATVSDPKFVATDLLASSGYAVKAGPWKATVFAVGWRCLTKWLPIRAGDSQVADLGYLYIVAPSFEGRVSLYVDVTDVEFDLPVSPVSETGGWLSPLVTFPAPT